MSEYLLTKEIITLSDASNWDTAKLEWSLASVYREEVPDTCLCGHFPILEICILRNRQNGNEAIVGNVCVKKFIGLPSDKIFRAVKRVQKDVNKALNAETIQHAHNKRWINDWEREFYFDIMRRRKLSAKQASKKVQINEKLLKRIVRARP